MTTFAPGPGPKPNGPTHPTPTGPKPRLDAIAAPELLAQADAYLEPSAEHLLTDALRLVDGQLKAATVTPGEAFRLTSAGFHIERALAELARLKSPVRQSDQSSAAVGLNAIATAGGPGPTQHWHDFLLPPPRPAAALRQMRASRRHGQPAPPDQPPEERQSDD